MDFAINAKPLERYMPTNKASFKYKIWKLVVSTGFEYFILLLITVNTVILMMKVCFWKQLFYMRLNFISFNTLLNTIWYLSYPI